MSLPPSRSAGSRRLALPGSTHGCNRRLVKVAAGGAGGRAPDLRGPASFGDEVDDALLRLEGPGHALGGPGLLAAEDEAGVADRPAVTHGGDGAGIG